jgi:hypothetical protein
VVELEFISELQNSVNFSHKQFFLIIIISYDVILQLALLDFWTLSILKEHVVSDSEPVSALM